METQRCALNVVVTPDFDQMSDAERTEATEWFQLVGARIPSIIEPLLEGGFMDRVVICHGDAHKNNVVIRQNGEDLMLIDFDLMFRAPAWFEFVMKTGISMFSMKTGMPLPHPSLEDRRAVALAYLNATGEQASGYSHNSVDDIVYDFNK